MFNKKLVLSAAFIAMMIFGIVMAVLGSVLPSVILKFEISMVNAGSLFLLMSLGMLVGSVVFGPVVDRYGHKGLMVIATVLILLGIQGIALAPSMLILKAALILTGFAGGAINGGANALVADINDQNRGSGLSYLGVFFGIGAVSVPFLLGSLLGKYSFESLISAVGFLIFIPLIFFLSIRFPVSKHTQGFPIADGLKLLREKMLILFGLVLFIQSGLEMVISGWSATFFNDVLKIDAQESVLLLSVYWLAMMAARIGMGRLLKQNLQYLVLNVSIITAIAGTLLMIMAPGKAMAVAGLALTGLGFAAVFPLVLAFVGDTYARLSGTAFSLVLAFGLLGGMLLPWMAGIIAEISGLRISLIIAPLCLSISIILLNWINRHLKTK
jgi:MFS transporter, FHS family, glucose/mannose:H+ symporter